jgi:hypothetical protein
MKCHQCLRCGYSKKAGRYYCCSEGFWVDHDEDACQDLILFAEQNETRLYEM